MLTIFLIYFFLLGVIIGSFLNVVVLRHNTGKTVGGRSSCMTCKSTLTAKELVPILSFVAQKGKCAHCESKISLQYPLVELVTGLLFAANFYTVYLFSSSITELVVMFSISATILALLVAIFVYDLRHKIIPDKFSFPVGALAVVYVLLSIFVFKNNPFWFDISNINTLWWINLCMGIILYVLIYLLWKISDGRLIGLGDAKLLFGMGTILGFVYGLSTLFLSFWIGSIFAIFLLLKERLRKGGEHITMKSEIAFGPFLIIAFLIVYFLKIDVSNIGFIIENFS